MSFRSKPNESDGDRTRNLRIDSPVVDAAQLLAKVKMLEQLLKIGQQVQAIAASCRSAHVPVENDVGALP